MRHHDGSAGDANYGEIGRRYVTYRQPEPAIEAMIRAALGDANTVLNIGAGAGSYEPIDRAVTAVEPSASMRAQRPDYLTTATDAVAENLPFADNCFDAAMATFTVHQWRDLEAGLGEMRRVSRGPAVILTCDPAEVPRFWLNDYAPEMVATEARRYPAMDRLRAGLGELVQVLPVPIPLQCRDGFHEAYYGRPEMILDEGARLSNSAWSFVAPDLARACVKALKRDLDSGRWDEKYGALRSQPTFRGSLYLVVASTPPIPL